MCARRVAAGLDLEALEKLAHRALTNGGVQFPLFSKISVVGPDQHSLYAALTISSTLPA